MKTFLILVIAFIGAIALPFLLIFFTIVCDVGFKRAIEVMTKGYTVY